MRTKQQVKLWTIIAFLATCTGAGRAYADPGVQPNGDPVLGSASHSDALPVHDPSVEQATADRGSATKLVDPQGPQLGTASSESRELPPRDRREEKPKLEGESLDQGEARKGAVEGLKDGPELELPLVTPGEEEKFDPLKTIIARAQNNGIVLNWVGQLVEKAASIQFHRSVYVIEFTEDDQKLFVYLNLSLGGQKADGVVVPGVLSAEAEERLGAACLPDGGMIAFFTYIVDSSDGLEPVGYRVFCSEEDQVIDRFVEVLSDGGIKVYDLKEITHRYL